MGFPHHPLPCPVALEQGALARAQGGIRLRGKQWLARLLCREAPKMRGGLFDVPGVCLCLT